MTLMCSQLLYSGHFKMHIGYQIPIALPIIIQYKSNNQDRELRNTNFIHPKRRLCRHAWVVLFIVIVSA